MWEVSWDSECLVSKALSWSCLSSGGLASDKDYPFQGHWKPHRCLAKKYKKVAWIHDFTRLSSNEQGTARVDMEGGGRETRIEADCLAMGNPIKLHSPVRKAATAGQVGLDGTLKSPVIPCFQQLPATWPPTGLSL